MLLQSFLYPQTLELPEILEPRENGKYYLIGAMLFFSFILIAFVKRNNQRSISSLFRGFISTSGIDQRSKETVGAGSFASVLLMFNYLMNFAICSFLVLDYVGMFSTFMNLWIAIIVPIALLFLQLTPVFIISGVAGNNLPLYSITKNSMIGFQLGGLFLSALALVWILNPQWNSSASYVLIFMLLAIQLARLLKNSFLVLSSGVMWYYILLYLCTLEILPLFVAFYYVKLNFVN